jgi:hypothetical protein
VKETNGPCKQEPEQIEVVSAKPWVIVQQFRAPNWRSYRRAQYSVPTKGLHCNA